MSILLPSTQGPVHEVFELDRITLFHLRPRLQFPFKTSFGVQRERDTILVVMHTRDGMVGVGEAPTLSQPIFDEYYMLGEYDALQRFFLPVIRDQLGGRIVSFDAMWKTLQVFKGHSFAKCGLDAAYWHLVSQQTGQSLAALWGGQQDRVPAGFSIGGHDLTDVLERAEKAVEAGFMRLKIKVWPGFEKQVMAALRERYPAVMLQVDANCAYDPFDPHHRAALLALDMFDLLLIEQPFARNDLFDHARFQAENDLRTPITLDESIRSLDDARRAIEIWRHFGIGDRLIINIKPGRVGGYWESRLIADLCAQESIACWIGGMLELGPGKWMNIALASHPACTLPGDHLQPQPYYEQDIADPVPTLVQDGMIPVPSAGLGCIVDWGSVERLTIHRYDVAMG